MKLKINSEWQKVINKLLQLMLVVYFVGLLTCTIIVNERVVLKTDVISKIERAKYGGGNVSKIDRYYLQSREHCLANFYIRIPSIRIIMERGRCREGNEVSYYADEEQIKRRENQVIKECAGLGVVVGKDCPKNAWYWFTLFSYVLKDARHFFFASAALFVLLLVFHKPMTHADLILEICIIIYFIIWVLVF